jgi:hypothetical protein
MVNSRKSERSSENQRASTKSRRRPGANLGNKQPTHWRVVCDKSTSAVRRAGGRAHKRGPYPIDNAPRLQRSTAPIWALICDWSGIKYVDHIAYVLFITHGGNRFFRERDQVPKVMGDFFEDFDARQRFQFVSSQECSQC